MANHKTNKAGYADVVTMMRELIEGHKETHDKNHPRDFIDCYLTEILKTDNQQSSFYKERGEDNLTTLLIDLSVVSAENICNNLTISVGQSVGPLVRLNEFFQSLK